MTCVCGEILKIVRAGNDQQSPQFSAKSNSIVYIIFFFRKIISMRQKAKQFRFC